MHAVSKLRSLVATRALTGRSAAPQVAVARVLGARQAVQALVVDRTGWHALSAAVDVLHGASMLVLLADRRWRRFAAGQAATAAVLVALELRASRR